MAAAAVAWADLPLDVLGEFMAHLPLPADRARFGAVCRPWRSAARHFASRMPWIVLPSGGFCATNGHDADFFRIPGVFAENVTCLGAAAADGWLAIDCTDDTCRRTPFWQRYCAEIANYKDDPRPDVKHKHNYMLYNLFSDVTVPLPELDAVIGHVTETFEVRKVLMRSSSPDDVIAVTTNHDKYNVIMCRSGKGTFVLPYYRIVDVAFIENTLYGITSGEELLAFHLSEDEDGRPNVASVERVIKNPLADYYRRDSWSWPQEEGGSDNEDHNGNIVDGDDSSRNENCQESNTDDEEPYQEDKHNEEYEESESEEEEEEEEDDNSESDDDEAANPAWQDIIYDGCIVSDNEKREGSNHHEDTYEAEDETYMGRYLVQSCSGELLLVRHQHLSSPHFESYTLNVEVFKADFCMGQWTASNGLGKGEALFLSRSFSKCARVCGDIEEGFVYYVSQLDDVFDTISKTTCEMTFEWPWQCIREDRRFLTWLFPPESVV